MPATALASPAASVTEIRDCSARRMPGAMALPLPERMAQACTSASRQAKHFRALLPDFSLRE